MTPLRQQFRERSHDKPAQVCTGMWQHQLRTFLNNPALSDKVQVQGPRRIGRSPSSTKILFDLLQGRHHGKRIQRRLDKRNAIRIGRLSRVRPGGGPPPAGSGDDRQPVVWKAVEGGVQQILAPTMEPG